MFPFISFLIDIVQSQWQQSPDGSQKIRQVSFTVTLNHVMGPKVSCSFLHA